MEVFDGDLQRDGIVVIEFDSVERATVWLNSLSFRTQGHPGARGQGQRDRRPGGMTRFPGDWRLAARGQPERSRYHFPE